MKRKFILRSFLFIQNPVYLAYTIPSIKAKAMIRSAPRNPTSDLGAYKEKKLQNAFK